MALSTTQGVTDEHMGLGAPTGSGARVRVANIILYNLATEAEETLRSCDSPAPSYRTGAGDTPANQAFRPDLGWPSPRHYFHRAGEPLRHLMVTAGELTLDNHDGYYDTYLDPSAYTWRRVELAHGGLLDAYTAFEDAGSFLIPDAPRAEREGLIRVPLAGALLDLDRPAYDSKFPGFAAALIFDGSVTRIVGSRDLNFASGEDAYLRFDVTTDSTSTQMYLLDKVADRGGTPNGWGIYFNSSGVLVWESYVSGTVSSTNLGSANELQDGSRHTVQITLSDDTGDFRTYFDGTLKTTGTWTAPDTNEQDVEVGRRNDATNYFDGTLDEIVVYTGDGIRPENTTTDDILLQHREGPASVQEVGAQLVWHLDEDNGTSTVHGYEPASGDTLTTPKSQAIRNTGAVNEGVAFGDVLDIDRTESRTLSGWFRTDSNHDGALLCKKQDATAGNAGYMVTLTSGGNLALYLSDGTDQVILSGAVTFNDSCWRRWLAIIRNTADGDTADLYFSDTSGTVWTAVATGTDISSVGDMSNAVALQWGQTGAGGRRFDGDLASVLVSDEALTTARMSVLGAQTHPSTSDEGSIIGYWAVDDSTAGSTIADSAGSNDGTKGSAATWTTRNGTITLGTGKWTSSLTGSHAHKTAGTYQQQVYGQCRGVPGIPLDLVGHDYGEGFNEAVWGFHWGPNPMSSVQAVFEGGKQLNASTYRVVYGPPTLVYIDVSGGALPSAPITIRGKGATFAAADTAYTAKLGLILREILTENSHLTASQVLLADVQALDSTWPYTSGVVILGGEKRPVTIGDVLRDALGPRLLGATDFEGSTWIPVLGAVNPDDYTAVISLDDTVIEDIRPMASAKRVREVRVGYARQWRPLTENEFLVGAAPADQKRFGAEWSWAVAKSSTVQDEDSRVLILTSALDTHDDALAEAQAILALMDGTWPIEVDTIDGWGRVQMARAASGAVTEPTAQHPDIVGIASERDGRLASEVKFLVTGLEPLPDGGLRLSLWRPE